MSGYKSQASGSSMPKGEEVVRMFDRISPVYDLMNRLMSLGMDLDWRRKAIASLGIQPGARVLDLACGTGDMSVETTRSVQDIWVVGIDPSPAMVNVGRQRLSGNGVVLVRGWAESLPFGDNAFDRAMMAFGIRNFSDRLQALQELHRVLIPGGKAAILEMTTRKQALLETLFGWYFRGVVPIIGSWISRDKSAYHHLPTSVDAFHEPLEFAGEMAASGWRSVKWSSLAGGVVTLFVADK